MTKPLRYALWCAVSSEEQAKHISLEVQEREGREFVERQGGEIVRVFMWDGYSRWESDPIAALEDFAAQGRFEYHELRQMWRERAFDVLVVYTHSRAGRSFTMQSWVVENVIRSGARVYRIQGGWIDKADYAWQIGMGGVLTTSEIDRLVKARDDAMNARARQGLPTSSGVLFSHIVRRDPMGRPLVDSSGQPLPIAVDERLRRLWNDVATLLLEGVSWKSMEIELYQRFGHVDQDNNPYATNAIRFALRHPTFWGHSARFYNTSLPGGQRMGAWVYDESVPPPEDVLLYRNTHEPVYKGELAERIKAELTRRDLAVRGNAKKRIGRFSGLFVCGECTYYFGYSRRWHYTYLYCGARNVGAYKSRICNQDKGITEQEAETFIRRVLEQAVDSGSLSAVFDSDSHGDGETEPGQRVDALEQELADVEAQVQRLVVKQATAPASLSHIYDAEIQNLGERYTILRENLERTRHLARQADNQTVQEKRVIAELVEMTLEGFWQQSDQAIHQMLHRLFGKRRLIVLDGKIRRYLVDAPPAKRR